MSSAFQNYGSNGMCSVLSGPFATGSFLYTHTVLVVVVGPYMLLNSLQATSNLADCTTNTASLSCDDTTMRFNLHSYTYKALAPPQAQGFGLTGPSLLVGEFSCFSYRKCSLRSTSELSKVDFFAVVILQHPCMCGG